MVNFLNYFLKDGKVMSEWMGNVFNFFKFRCLWVVINNGL